MYVYIKMYMYVYILIDVPFINAPLCTVYSEILVSWCMVLLAGSGQEDQWSRRASATVDAGCTMRHPACFFLMFQKAMDFSIIYSFSIFGYFFEKYAGVYCINHNTVTLYDQRIRPRRRYPWEMAISLWDAKPFPWYTVYKWVIFQSYFRYFG